MGSPVRLHFALLALWGGLMPACAASSGPLRLGSAEILTISPAGETRVRANFGPPAEDAPLRIVVHDEPRHTFLGVGGSLTQAAAAALRPLPPERRRAVLAAFFGPDGAHYGLARTHIGSADFSEYSYSYAPDEDPELRGFSIAEDEKNGLLDLIRDARALPGARFELVASPWTAPAWMKDNGKLYDPASGRGGQLRPEHYTTFARYFVKYLEAYRAAGIPVWAVTPVNEPQGNAGTWESMEMSPEVQRDFLRVLGPALREAGLETRVLIFDQNRRELPEFTKVVYGDPVASEAAFGAAVHWYNSTFRVYEDVLDEQRSRYPDKVIIHSEGTIDSVSGEASCKEACRRPPCGCEPLYVWWQNDGWYWRKEATDWGWDWAENREADHPKYAPALRYARDLVVGIGHGLSGWIDWNIVLDKRGGPNHVGNYCLAPVMVEAETQTVYFTPLYAILKQVSRHSRPGSTVLETDEGTRVRATALRNPNGEIAVHLFNESGQTQEVEIQVGARALRTRIPHPALQTVVIPK